MMTIGKFKILDDCGTRKDVVLQGAGNPLYSERIFFALPEEDMNSIQFISQQFAKGRPYYYLGIRREVMGRKYIDYRVDVYPNDLAHDIGTLKEHVSIKFWKDVYQDIVN